MWALDEVGKALSLSFTMFWEVLWPLGLGFLLSASFWRRVCAAWQFE
jgi:hypothetical protein